MNNPTELLDFDELGARYLIYSLEIGEEGTEHFQGYIQFERQKSLNKVIALLPGAHISIARGTPDENKAYCSKLDETHLEGPWEFGEMKSQGQRSDLAHVQSMIKEGKTIQEIAETHFSDYVRYSVGITKAKDLLAPRLHEKKYKLEDFSVAPLDLSKAVLIIGPTGIGKTQFALSHFNSPILIRHIDDLALFSPNIHDGIVFDDMTFKHWPATSIIHLLDFDEGSSINIRYKVAYIPKGTRKIFCSNVPSIFYPENLVANQRDAIDRRHHEVFFEASLFE